MIDQEKFGKLIAELRKEAGLTQEEFAERLFVGREAVSKWERGIGLPGHALLLEISKQFDITINELLYGERITKTNEEEVEEAPYKWIDIISIKLHSVKKKYIITFIALIVVIIIYFISCLIFNYNSFKIYSTYTSNGDITFKKGLIVKYHDILYFKFGNIVNHTKDEIKDIHLYYDDKDKGERIEILSGSTLDDTVITITKLEELTSQNFKDVLRDLHIEIITDNEVYKCDIETDLNFKANLLSKEEKTEEHTEEDNIDAQSLSDEESYIRDKFKLKDGEYVYEFKYKEKNYKCLLIDNEIQMKENGVLFRYRINSDEIDIVYKDKITFYDINSKKCEPENCSKYKDDLNTFINNVLK